MVFENIKAERWHAILETHCFQCGYINAITVGRVKSSIGRPSLSFSICLRSFFDTKKGFLQKKPVKTEFVFVAVKIFTTQIFLYSENARSRMFVCEQIVNWNYVFADCYCTPHQWKS